MARQATSAGGVALRSILRNRIFWILAAVWIVTRALMIVQVGFWNDLYGTNFQDADQY